MPHKDPIAKKDYLKAYHKKWYEKNKEKRTKQIEAYQETKSEEYTDHVQKTQEAMKAALKAKVNYEAIKIWIDLKRTEAANERVLAKL